MKKIPSVEVKILRTVALQYIITMDTFRKFLGVPKNVTLIDITMGNDDGSKHTRLQIDAKQLSPKELKEREFTRLEEAGEIK